MIDLAFVHRDDRALDDVAALAVHLMINTAVTGASYDIDGGHELYCARA